jgi:hypothetical protein
MIQLLLFALLVVVHADQRPMSTCPLAELDMYTITPSDSSHGALVLHNPTQSDNVVSVTVAWQTPHPGRRPLKESDPFLLIVPAGGSTPIDLGVYVSNATVSVTFDTLPWRTLCEEVYWSENRNEPGATNFVSLDGTTPDQKRYENEFRAAQNEFRAAHQLSRQSEDNEIV